MSNYSILVVEDEITLRRLLVYRLQKTFDVRVATNGREALDLVAESPPDLIVSDIMMPLMDGYALRRALAEDPSTRIIPFIFLTAKIDDDSRKEALRDGVDDYMTKPFDLDAVVARIQQLLERANIYQTRLNARISQDFSNKLLPRSMPVEDGYVFDHLNLPREQGGGDFVDWLRHPSGAYYITIGDVMGKGIQAKFYAFSFLSYVRGTIHAMMRVTESPGQVITAVNDLLVADPVMEETFASLLLYRWDPVSHEITYCNAGHCRPMLVSGSGVRILEEGSMILGLAGGTQFEDHAIQLRPGEAFVSYTDGMIEQPRANGGLVGEEGLMRAADYAWGQAEPLKVLSRTLLAQSDADEFHDDVLALWLARQST
jgi:serine phosphatase RsbU (regulator of sigma subunit)